MNGQFEAVIGLEVHVQLSTQSKCFCRSRARSDSVAHEQVNGNLCEVCAGHPGTLPVLNHTAVEYAIRAGLATNCTIRERSRFSRKNYFYPDLPKGYQISQYDEPLCESGWLEIVTVAGAPKRVRITRIHMEEDAGKNVHHVGYSLVNLNRAGVPLVEVVSAPDLSSAEEASAYLKVLHAIVTSIGICDGNLEEGNFRCDANVSVRRRGDSTLGTRVEVKNVNSFRFVERAIQHEIARQVDVIESGGSVVQETRGYDSDRDLTFSQRTKEQAHDYRYFPDPDLLPLRVTREWVEQIRAGLPELPEQRRARYLQLKVHSDQAHLLAYTPELSHLFDEAVRAGGPANILSALVCGEVMRLQNESGSTQVRIKASALAEVAGLQASATVSSTAAKQLILKLWEQDEPVHALMERLGLRQLSDVSALEKWIDQAIAEFPAQSQEYRLGKDKVLGFLVGQVMKSSGGKANPSLVQEVLTKKLRGGE
jgi:aspartyl-tRNA(Asn)/glutamyl-tRNA(Gln) amidotransferase subunit B